ncbi:hypothetical protein Back11_27540 [Paenibacillus baekrokdamisoli]|uniref:Uncharacterized protein n=1 Tax=Paenibacillus baekrokdamisoli TaxID=1712516 RepID=A0A3G9JEM1_9BACL|nr:extracellular solute-binding protein [Paenibacillus baekrokdamisoli]MBB3070408.1 ABC-type glycerol-3-phosphate transport system substrate-binding protein [Paenibacillus baekrokdamisoli]BBH21409.1 hypothetical protein Back11_27540 [Paenibacillus baekrokdamisoli]
MRKLRLTSLTLTVILLFAVILTACSGNSNKDSSPNTSSNTQTPKSTETDTPEPAAPEKPKEPVTLKYVTYFVGQYQAEYDLFHKKYPWITIEPIVTDDVLGTVVAKVAAGDSPDLAIVDNMTTFVQQDLLEELTPYMESSEILKTAKIRNGISNIYKLDNKNYAMPISDVPLWMAVNKDLLAKHGLEMPTNDWTYDDFLEMAKQATDLKAGEYGVSYDTTFNSWFTEIYAMANGAIPNFSYMNEDLTKTVFNTPEVAASLKWVSDLTYKWHVRPTTKEAESYGWDSGNNFLAGKSLFGVGADWYVPGFNDNAKFEWDVLPFPVGKKMQATMHLNAPFGIMKTSKNKEAAFLWLTFQYELEAQKWMIENSGTAFVDDPELTSYYEKVDVWKGKNVGAIERTGEICCYTKTPAILDVDWLNANVISKLNQYFYTQADLTPLLAAADQYNNQVVIDARKALGLK